MLCDQRARLLSGTPQACPPIPSRGVRAAEPRGPREGQGPEQGRGRGAHLSQACTTTTLGAEGLSAPFAGAKGPPSARPRGPAFAWACVAEAGSAAPVGWAGPASCAPRRAVTAMRMWARSASGVPGKRKKSCQGTQSSAKQGLGQGGGGGGGGRQGEEVDDTLVVEYARQCTRQRAAQGEPHAPPAAGWRTEKSSTVQRMKGAVGNNEGGRGQLLTYSSY